VRQYSETVLNGFRFNFAFVSTWLKPGVNEMMPAAIVSALLRQSPLQEQLHANI